MEAAVLLSHSKPDRLQATAEEVEQDYAREKGQQERHCLCGERRQFDSVLVHRSSDFVGSEAYGLAGWGSVMSPTQRWSSQRWDGHVFIVGGVARSVES